MAKKSIGCHWEILSSPGTKIPSLATKLIVYDALSSPAGEGLSQVNYIEIG